RSWTSGATEASVSSTSVSRRPACFCPPVSFVAMPYLHVGGLASSSYLPRTARHFAPIVPRPYPLDWIAPLSNTGNSYDTGGLAMSPASLTMAGTLLITVPAVAYGGVTLLRFLMRYVPGYLDNPLRRGLSRAGHAHAGVLVLFSLVAMLYVDQADLSESVRTLVRLSIVAAPILMPLGLFLSVVRPGDTKPNGLIALTFLGGASLAAGTLTLGIGLV